MIKILEFTGEYAFLSNFWEEEDHHTNEHYFQMAKTDDLDWKERILCAETPGKAKRLGRKAPLRPTWNDERDQVMLALVSEKFEDPELAAKLLATGDAELVEGNTWGDTYWGACWQRQPDHATTLWAIRANNGYWEGLMGHNKLGRILMQVRAELGPND